MFEEWAFIERTNEEYSVSSYGKIRSNARIVMRGNDGAPKWIKTADRLPTEADAGVDEEILTIYDDGETRVMGTDYWAYVAKAPERFLYWIPVPKLPEVEG